VARADAAIRLIAEAVKKAGPGDSAKLADAIHKLKSVKTPGGTFTFDEKGEGLKQNLLGQWKKGNLNFCAVCRLHVNRCIGKAVEGTSRDL